MTSTDLAILALLGAVLLTMPWFAVVSRTRPRDADVARRPATVLLGYWVRDWLMWFIGPADRALVRAGVSPDVFNFLGLAMGLASGAAYAVGMLSLGGWLLLLGGVADIFDGRIARARNITSEYGDFIDATLDRFAECFTFLGIAVFVSGSRWGIVAAAGALGGSLLVSYARARGEIVGVDCAGGLMQRAERLVLVAVASFADAPATAYLHWAPGTVLVGGVGIVGAASFATAAYRTAWISRVLLRRAQQPASAQRAA